MAMILPKEQLYQHLRNYYLEHWGESSADKWYEQPAVNVWVFGRDGKIITLKAHVLTGEVEERIETMQKGANHDPNH